MNSMNERNITSTNFPNFTDRKVKLIYMRVFRSIVFAWEINSYVIISVGSLVATTLFNLIRNNPIICGSNYFCSVSNDFYSTLNN